MFNLNDQNDFFISCPVELEEELLKEIPHEFEKDYFPGGVFFQSTIKEAIPVILNSRIGSRSYIKLHAEKVYHEKDFYKLGKKIDWHKIFKLNQTFKINVIQNKNSENKRSKFKNAQFLGQVFKDGLVDRYRKEAKDERPSVDKKRPDLTIFIHLEPMTDSHSEMATIYIDPIGRPLGDRGYRSDKFDGSLRENLAAGILSIIDADPQSPFYDFMCGSGTMLFEEAMRRLNIPPSYIYLSQKLPLAIEKLLCFDHETKDFVKTYKYELMNTVGIIIRKKSFNFPKIKGSDKNPEAIKLAKRYLERTALSFCIDIEQKDAFKLTPQSEGIFFANVPYGIRLGANDPLEKLYHDIGEYFKKNMKGTDLYLFTANRELIKKIRLQTSMKKVLFNSNLEARLVRYKLY